MALRDFIHELRVLHFAGRRLVVRKPTVETVCLAQLLFLPEMAGCRLAWTQAEPKDRPADPVAALLPFFIHEGKLTHLLMVLETCVDAGPVTLREAAMVEGPGEARVLAERLIRAAVEMSDVPRLIKFLGLDEFNERLQAPAEPAAPEPEMPGPGAVELAVCGLAKHFSLDPDSVMRWPVERFISVAQDILPALYPPEEDHEDVYGFTRAEWRARGVDITREH